MSENNNQKYFDDTIVINNIVSENLEDIITIYSKDLHSQYLDKNSSYKVSSEGKIVVNSLTSDLNEEPKERLIKELINFSFEKIPDNLTEIELKDILKYSINNIEKTIEYGKIDPYKAEVTDSGDLKIILLIYNGGTINLILGQLPLKLKDANNKVILAKFIDINNEVSPGKIGICYLKVNKETLMEEKMDLTTWTITFEV